jgi:hypothetical protein
MKKAGTRHSNKCAAVAADGEIRAVLVDCNQGNEKKEMRFFEKLSKSVPELLRIAIVEPSGVKQLLAGGLSSSIVTKPWTYGELAKTVAGQLKSAGALFQEGSRIAEKNGFLNTHIKSAFQEGFDLYSNLLMALNPITQTTKEKGNMAYQDKFMGSVMDMTRMSMETGMQSLENIQSQAERAIEMTISNMNVVQEETSKALNSWLDTAKQARKLYSSAIEEGMGTMQQTYASTKAPKSK